MFKKWGFFHHTSIFWDIKKTDHVMDTYPPSLHKTRWTRDGITFVYFYFEVLFKVDVISIRAKVPFLK